jgi:hypothetical protein
VAGAITCIRSRLAACHVLRWYVGGILRRRRGALTTVTTGHIRILPRVI